jgi:hypothetical protein
VIRRRVVQARSLLPVKLGVTIEEEEGRFTLSEHYYSNEVHLRDIEFAKRVHAALGSLIDEVTAAQRPEGV